MERPAKAHRAPQSGRSAEKKKDAKDKGAKKQGFNEKVKPATLPHPPPPSRLAYLDRLTSTDTSSMIVACC